MKIAIEIHRNLDIVSGCMRNAFRSDFCCLGDRFWLPLGTLFASQMAPKTIQTAFQELQEPQRGSKDLPRAPKIVPKRLPGGPKRLPGGPKRLPRVPRRPPRGPQEAPKSPQESPSGPKELPEGLQEHPRCLQEACRHRSQVGCHNSGCQPLALLERPSLAGSSFRANALPVLRFPGLLKY